MILPSSDLMASLLFFFTETSCIATANAENSQVIDEQSDGS